MAADGLPVPVATYQIVKDIERSICFLRMTPIQSPAFPTCNGYKAKRGQGHVMRGKTNHSRGKII